MKARALLGVLVTVGTMCDVADYYENGTGMRSFVADICHLLGRKVDFCR
jgi:hypothetical protein